MPLSDEPVSDRLPITKNLVLSAALDAADDMCVNAVLGLADETKDCAPTCPRCAHPDIDLVERRPAAAGSEEVSGHR